MSQRSVCQTNGYFFIFILITGGRTEDFTGFYMLSAEFSEQQIVREKFPLQYFESSVSFLHLYNFSIINIILNNFWGCIFFNE